MLCENEAAGIVIPICSVLASVGVPVIEIVDDLRAAWAEVSGKMKGNVQYREELA